MVALYCANSLAEFFNADVNAYSCEISKLWFKCYGEDLKTEYSGFYNKLTKLEKTINEEEREIEKQREKAKNE